MNLQLSEVKLGEFELREVLDSLTTGYVTMGAKVQRFEEKFAEYIGAKHAVMVNSGSSANLAMVKALATLIPGEKVLVPALSWSTTLWPVIQAGLKPVLMDIDPDTLNIGLEQLNHALRLHKDAKGMVVAHIMGNPSPMEELMRGHDLKVVEDSCETLGSVYQGRKTGTWGLSGSFSFYFSHHMTTIEGGMIVTDSTEFMEKISTLRSHGWSRALKSEKQRKFIEGSHPDIDPRFLFIGEGYNLRPTELNAAIGLHQLDKLDNMNLERKIIEKRMREIVEPYDIQPIKITEGSEAALFAFPVLMRDSDTQKAFSAYLESRGIQTRPIVAGNLARHPAFRNVETIGSLPGAEKVADCGLYWGLHPYITDEQLEHLGGVIKEYFKGRMAA